MVMVSPVPPPSVAVTADPDRTLYADEDVTLTCDITLDPAVDSEVAVTASWTGPGGPITDGVSDIAGSGLAYQSTLTLSSLTTSDSGLYTCTASVDPAVPTPLVVGSGDGTGGHTITVGKDQSTSHMQLYCAYNLGTHSGVPHVVSYLKPTQQKGLRLCPVYMTLLLQDFFLIWKQMHLCHALISEHMQYC